MADTLMALGTVLTGLLAAFGGLYSIIRRESRISATISREELRAIHDAWLEGLRTIRKMRTFIAINGLEEPEEWQINEIIEKHEKAIMGEEKKK